MVGRALREALGRVGLGLAAATLAGGVAVAPGDAASSLRESAAVDACDFLLASGDWNTSGSWSCNHVPTTSDAVTVSGGQTAQVGAAASAGDLTVSGTLQFTAPVVLTISGTYTQSATGTLGEQIAGTTPGTQFDQLIVSGGATLGGTLAVQSGGFTPAPTDAFKVIAAASRSGTFAAVTGGGGVYAPRYDPDGVMLLVVPANTAPPSIPSGGHPGDLVTCDPGAWTGTPTFTFAWTSDAAPIAGQTAQTYTLASGDVGHLIRCSVAAHNGVDSAPVDSNALTVTPPAPTSTGAPAIPASGHPGDVVTCNPGAWTGAASFTYAWTRDGAVIAGQTASTYTLVDADAGHTIRCRVTAHNAGGDSAPLDSNGLVAVIAAPTSSTAPSIPAAGHSGDKITCSPGAWTGSPTFTFAWTRDGTAVAGQTAPTYTLADADAGHAIRCRVTAHNAGGDSAAVDSNALSASIAVPKNTVAPSIPSAGRPGDVVTCNAGSWTGAPALTYAWLRNDVLIRGQTGKTYKLTNNDVSQEIRCRVGAHNAGGDGAAAESNALAVVKGPAVGGCAICILGAPSRTNLVAAGTGSVTARAGSILINGKARVTGSGKITAASIGMYPRPSTKANFKPTRPAALVHAVKDPLASRALPSVSQACKTSTSAGLRPGVYCGLDVVRRNVTLAPGLYVFTGIVQLGGGGALSGHGVTIFITHGSLVLSSGSTLDVSAAASGRYKGIAIAFGRTNGAAFSIAGSTRATVGGAIYGKAASLSLTGASTLTCSGGPIAVARLTRSGKASLLVRPAT